MLFLIVAFVESTKWYCSDLFTSKQLSSGVQSIGELSLSASRQDRQASKGQTIVGEKEMKMLSSPEISINSMAKAIDSNGSTTGGTAQSNPSKPSPFSVFIKRFYSFIFR